MFLNPTLYVLVCSRLRPISTRARACNSVEKTSPAFNHHKKAVGEKTFSGDPDFPDRILNVFMAPEHSKGANRCGHCGVCMSTHHIFLIVIIGIIALVIIIILVLFTVRKRRLHCKRLVRRTVSYNMQTSQGAQGSQQNPVYGHQTAAGVAPTEEERMSGCEIYGDRDDILTYEQKKQLGLCSVHRSTQTLSLTETTMYDNFPLSDPIPATMDPHRGRSMRDIGPTCSEMGDIDYDYPVMPHNSTSSRDNKERHESNIYEWANGRGMSSQNSPTSRRNSNPPPCGQYCGTCPPNDVTDQPDYVNPDGCNTCTVGEAALSDVTIDDSDSDSSENEDYSHKIYIDQRFLNYVNTLKRNHNMYIERYKTKKRTHNRQCSIKTGMRRRANTGVLKLLERRTSVRQTFSIPVSIEPVSVRPRRPPPPCPKEVDYLKLIS